jgi:hypothetical protein
LNQSKCTQKLLVQFLNYLCGGGEGDANFDGAAVRVVSGDHAVLGRAHLRLAFLHPYADHISYIDPASTKDIKYSDFVFVLLILWLDRQTAVGV